MMTMLLALRALLRGHSSSSRKIERACYEDLAFRVVARATSSRTTHGSVSSFAATRFPQGSFVQILPACARRPGLLSLAMWRLDGTSAGQCPMHKAMEHERMLRRGEAAGERDQCLMRRPRSLMPREESPLRKGKLGSELLDELRRASGTPWPGIRQAARRWKRETAAAAARQRARGSRRGQGPSHCRPGKSDAPAAERPILQESRGSSSQGQGRPVMKQSSCRDRRCGTAAESGALGA